MSPSVDRQNKTPCVFHFELHNQMSEKQTNVDFSTFQNQQECNGNESDINKCECINRIIHALK